jgi:branched-chain amino acid transport system permease protein
MDFALNTLTTCAIYIVLAVSFDLVIGYSGQFSVAHAAFYAIGAYGTGLIAVDFHVHIILAALAGVLIAAGFGLIIALVAIRVGGVYLVVASLSFQMVVVAALLNVSWLGGSLGVGNIPVPDLFGWQISSQWGYVILFMILAALTTGAVWVLAHSPFGRALKTLRENPVAAEALGKRQTYLKSWAFSIAGGMAGLAGAMYATYITYISSDSFGNDVNILIMAMVIVGGAGTIFGPLLGAIVLVVVPAVITFAPIPASVLGPAEQIAYALMLVVFVGLRPTGIHGLFPFGKAEGQRIIQRVRERRADAVTSKVSP